MKNNDNWLKEQCNRYTNGFCQTVACLKRGGYVRDKVPVNCDVATCEPYEILQELESYRNDE